MAETNQVDRNTIEFEARRVAAAFEVEEWETELHDDRWFFAENKDGRFFHASPSKEFGYENFVIQGPYGDDDRAPYCELQIRPEGNFLFYSGNFGDFMAHGLYRLGFSDESILNELPPLSAHEKLELRLSMPREYWPDAWLDEEKQKSLTSV